MFEKLKIQVNSSIRDELEYRKSFVRGCRSSGGMQLTKSEEKLV